MVSVPVTSLLLSLISVSLGFWVTFTFCHIILRMCGLKIAYPFKIAMIGWVIVIGVVLFTGVQTYGPRITVTQPEMYTPEYHKDPIINLNPHNKSDQQRLDETRKEFKRNSIEGDDNGR